MRHCSLSFLSSVSSFTLSLLFLFLLLSFFLSCFLSFFLSFFVSFSVPFLFLFLLLSFSFPFPFPFPFPRSCEFFDQLLKPALGKTIRGKKTDNVWKNHLKGLGVFTNPHMVVWVGGLEVWEIRGFCKINDKNYLS